MDTLTRGEVAKLSGIGAEAIRFYENEGLISKPKRSESGYRLYSHQDVKRIQFIKQAKELGFSLKEIQELLALRVTPKNSCHNVKELALHKIETIEDKIRNLHRVKRALKKLVQSCRGKGPTSDCPILEAIES